MSLKNKAALNTFMNKLKVNVTGVSRDVFKEEVNKLFEELKTKNLTIIKRAIQVYLLGHSGKTVGSSKMPIIKAIPQGRWTGNMYAQIIQNGMISKAPIYKEVGATKYRATITTWYGIDKDKKGAHTVFSKNKRSTYANILNVDSKHFAKYNGYLQEIEREYRDTFRVSLEDKLSKTFENVNFRYN